MHRRPSLGFTLVELMIGISVLAMLIMAAAPSLQAWVIGTRVRTAAEALQNGLRFAQTEAARQSRQVVFMRTSETPRLNAASSADGNNWSAQIVPVATLDSAPTRQLFLRGGPLADVAAGVTIEGSANSQAVCFSSLGALVGNRAPAPGTGATCAGGAVWYALSHPAGGRTLRVEVSVNGRVRMCDEAKTLDAANPDGCLPRT